MSELMSNGAHKERRAQIRLNSERKYSVFTWADYGGDIGIIQWREQHGIADWGKAYAIFCDWINGSDENENH